MLDNRETLKRVAVAAADRAVATTPRPLLRPATVVTAPDSTGALMIAVDGDGVTVEALTISEPSLPPGTRVMALHNPPHQWLVIGVVGGSSVEDEVLSIAYRETIGGATSNLSSAVYVVWPSASTYTFSAPVGASEVFFEAQLTGITKRLGGSATSQVRFRVGPTAGYPAGSLVGDAHSYENDAGNLQPRIPIIWRDRFAGGFTPGASVTVEFEGRRTSGSAELRRDSVSVATLTAMWII